MRKKCYDNVKGKNKKTEDESGEEIREYRKGKKENKKKRKARISKKEKAAKIVEKRADVNEEIEEVDEDYEGSGNDDVVDKEDKDVDGETSEEDEQETGVDTETDEEDDDSRFEETEEEDDVVKVEEYDEVNEQDDDDNEVDKEDDKEEDKVDEEDDKEEDEIDEADDEEDHEEDEEDDQVDGNTDKVDEQGKDVNIRNEEVDEENEESGVFNNNTRIQGSKIVDHFFGNTDNILHDCKNGANNHKENPKIRKEKTQKGIVQHRLTKRGNCEKAKDPGNEGKQNNEAKNKQTNKGNEGEIGNINYSNWCTSINTSHYASDEEIRNASAPLTFEFFITVKQWQSIFDNSCMLTGNWTDIFKAHFKKQNDVCPLTFHYNRCSKKRSRKKNAVFFRGKARCKFTGCAEYTFLISNRPDCRDPVKVEVHRNGKLRHLISEKHSEQARSQIRQRIKDCVKEKGPSTYMFEQMGKMSESAFEAGNMTICQNKQVLQKIASELKRSNDLHENLLQEIIIVKSVLFDEDDKSKSIKGYIQNIGASPLFVDLYTESQLEILFKAKNKGLYFDATGTVVCNIPNESKKMFYYALVSEGPSKRTPPLPVAEFLTIDHSVPSICGFLTRMRYSLSKLHSNAYVSRIEVDFSWAMLQSVSLAFNQLNIKRYIQETWNTLHGKCTFQEIKTFTVIHICAAHFMKKVASNVGMHTKDYQLKRFVTYVFARMQTCTALKSIGKIYHYLCIALLSKHNTEIVEDAIEKLGQVIAYVEAENETENLDVPNYESTEAISNETIRESSPYNKYFKKIKDYAESEIISSNSTENLYYNPSILNYISNQIMHLCPLWAGIMLKDATQHAADKPTETANKFGTDHSEIEKNRYTNCHVENWFKIVKNDTLQGRKRLRPALFIRKLHLSLKGRIKNYQMLLREKNKNHIEIGANQGKEERKSNAKIHEGQKDTYDVDKSVEKWQKRERKSTSYFTPPKSIPTPKKQKSINTVVKKSVEKNSKYSVRQKRKQPSVYSPSEYCKKKLKLDVPKWGGKVNVEGHTFELYNTCPIDNLLFGIHSVLKMRPDIVKRIEEKNDVVSRCLIEVNQYFSSCNWTFGKYVWLKKICGFSRSNPYWNAFGSEHEMVVKHLLPFHSTIQNSYCTAKDCPKQNRTTTATEINLQRTDQKTLQSMLNKFIEEHTEKCNLPKAKRKGSTAVCNGDRKWRKRKFVNGIPPMLILSPTYLDTVLRELKTVQYEDILYLNDTAYALYVVTCGRNDHFISSILTDHGWIGYDGLGPRTWKNDGPVVPDDHTVEHVIYVQVDV